MPKVSKYGAAEYKETWSKHNNEELINQRWWNQFESRDLSVKSTKPKPKAKAKKDHNYKVVEIKGVKNVRGILVY